MEPRDFQDPRYKAWRAAVYKRDRWKCKMPWCRGGDRRLNAHHIKCWSSYPALRYVVANGITLCRTCHATIRGRERELETSFMGIISAQGGDDAMKILMMRYGKEDDVQGS